MATRGAHLGCIRALVSAGASLTTKNRQGSSSKDLARSGPRALRNLVSACVRDAENARYLEAESRRAAERTAAEAERKRIDNIEKAMGMVHLIETQRTHRSLHQLPTAREKLKRLVEQRSLISGVMADKNRDIAGRERARLARGDDENNAGATSGGGGPAPIA
jgi:hypothetical protein